MSDTYQHTIHARNLSLLAV